MTYITNEKLPRNKPKAQVVHLEDIEMWVPEIDIPCITISNQPECLLSLS